ncbi:hypothetical protein [Mangrovicoccus algicola]|uniref:Uncharacterized protein n=1 Tax=Mangrovicoccus algicola TaxID=2771008 RepID=A0A8J6ZBW8_9RHOB|nr:hypothetical protein [Mangrovicoccus algicola]MBE3639776.1 hypothetical protein [Mangrovicoccus algicola]
MASPYMSLARAYQELGSSVVLSSGDELRSMHAARNPEWFGLDAEGGHPAMMVDRSWPQTRPGGKWFIEVNPRSWPQDTTRRRRKTERLLDFLEKFTGQPIGIVFCEFPPGGEGGATKIAPRPDLAAIVRKGETEHVYLLEVVKRQSLTA